MLRIAVIGAGYWGPNLIRNVHDSKKCELVAVCDINEDNLNRVGDQYKDFKLVRDFTKLVEPNKVIDAVVIATPVETHFGMVQYFLNKGIHVFAEKPLTRTSKETKELTELAKKKKLILMTGHVFMYHPNINKIRSIIAAGELGEVKVIQAVRTSLGPRVRTDVNIIWDYAVHECYILPYVLDSDVLAVNAVGNSYLQKDIEDWVNFSLYFDNGAVANGFVTWADPQKRRNFTIIGTKKMLFYDETAKDPLLLFDRGYLQKKGIDEFGNVDLELYDKGAQVVKVESGEPLKLEIEHFFDCIEKNEEPISGGYNAYDTLLTLETLQASLKNKGKYIEVKRGK